MLPVSLTPHLLSHAPRTLQETPTAWDFPDGTIPCLFFFFTPEESLCFAFVCEDAQGTEDGLWQVNALSPELPESYPALSCPFPLLQPWIIPQPSGQNPSEGDGGKVRQELG